MFMKSYFIKRENIAQFPFLIIGLLGCKHLEIQFSHKHNKWAIIVLSSQNFEIDVKIYYFLLLLMFQASRNFGI
jgi:hypothetical protein